MNKNSLDPVIVNIPCPSDEEAKRICSFLLDNELCGTAKILPMYLMYKDEKVEGEAVVLMSLKTTRLNLEKIGEYIYANHSWKTPCIEVMSILRDMC